MYHHVGTTGLELGVSHQSHKRVAAVRIMAIQHDTFDNQPVTRLIFDGIPSVTVPDTELRNKPVPAAGMYLIVYKDGYFSFHPGESFDEEYSRIDAGTNNTIGWAVKQLQNGSRVRRSGWNGKGMYLILVPGSVFKVNRKPLIDVLPEGTEVNYRSHVDICSIDGAFVPWNASQSDLLATDWEIAD